MSLKKLLMEENITFYMDNSSKGLDGSMYKTAKKPTDEFSVKDLMNRDVDYALLLWSDFANIHCSDHVVLKDRGI